MRIERSKSKRSRRSGNTQILDSFGQAMKMLLTRRRSMRTERSKGKKSRRSDNTLKSRYGRASNEDEGGA